jgi:hypothetical protein
MSDKSDRPPAEAEETVTRESHPSAGGPAGLAGDMGLSSERQGPFDGIEGTGSLASARMATDGESPPVEAPDAPVAAPGSMVPEDLEEPDESARVSDVDRTGGEVQPHPVANKHEFDPSRNPRH